MQEKFHARERNGDIPVDPAITAELLAHPPEILAQCAAARTTDRILKGVLHV